MEDTFILLMWKSGKEIPVRFDSLAYSGRWKDWDLCLCLKKTKNLAFFFFIMLFFEDTYLEQIQIRNTKKTKPSFQSVLHLFLLSQANMIIGFLCVIQEDVCIYKWTEVFRAVFSPYNAACFLYLTKHVR